ncbi:MAG: membrane protein insertase YidC [Myxococcota bacterium]
MDRNFLLAVVLSLLVVTLWTSQQSRTPEGADAEKVEQGASPGVASEANAAAAQADPRTVAESPALEASAPPALPDAPEERIEIRGDDYRAVLSSRGAVLVSYEITDYVSWDPPGEAPIDLLLAPETAPVRVGATPFEELGLGDLRAASFAVEERSEHGASFVLTRRGVTVRKTFRFEPDGHAFEFSVSVENASGELLSPRFAVEWPANQVHGNDYRQLSLVTLHDGSVRRVAVESVGSSGFLGLGGDKGEPNEAGEGGLEWFGVDTKYFIGVLAPRRTAGAATIYARTSVGTPARDGLFGASAVNVFRYAPIALPSGNRITQEFEGYVGPKLENELLAFGANLQRSIDLGYRWLEPLTHFFLWLLRALYSIVPNYGVAIIALTLLVRVATLPILQKQMKSMEKMRKLQPQMKEIQEKYGDDREKQSQAMMSLYRESGVNPLGGCLPLLLQMPVFIGLFYALQSSIELRHAPFVLWMTDLSAPESLFTIPGVGLPFRVLPILMSVSMAVQAKFQPAGPDPAQQRMMMVMMPIMMLVLFYQFPSGLVLYYMLSNFLGIAHQWWIGRNMKPAGA